MKTYISDIFPKLQRFSKKLDDLTLLVNQHWVMLDEINQQKIIYIFRNSKELLVSKNGKIERAKWEYLGNQSLVIDQNEGSYLFKHGFLDENVLALKLDGNEEFAVFVNENKYEGELNSLDRVLDFLAQKYLNNQSNEKIETLTGQNFKTSDENIINEKPSTTIVNPNKEFIKANHAHISPWIWLLIIFALILVFLTTN